MNDSKKLLKAMLGDQGYETLEKAIFKQRTQAVIDPLEFYLPLIVAPRTVISWLVQHIKPMKTGEIKDVEFPGRPEIKIHFEKQDIDQYRAEFVQAGRIIHTFEKQSLPAASAHLMTVGELYEEYGEGEKPAEEPMDNTPKAEAPKESYDMVRQMMSLSDIKAPQDSEAIKWEMSHANVRELTAVIGKLVDSLTSKQMSRDKLEDELDKVTEKEVKDVQGKLEASQTPEEKAKADAAKAKAADNSMSYRELDQLEAKPSTEQKGPESKVVASGTEAASAKISKENPLDKESLSESKTIHSASMQASKNISSPRMAGAHNDQDQQRNIAGRIESDTKKEEMRPKWHERKDPVGVHQATGSEGKGGTAVQRTFADQATRKYTHKRNLRDLKAMPKANLPKSEDQIGKAGGGTSSAASGIAANAQADKNKLKSRPVVGSISSVAGVMGGMGLGKEEMDKAEMPKGAGQPQQPAQAKPPKPAVPPGNQPAAAAAKQAQTSGKGGYKPPQTPGAAKPVNPAAQKQKMAPKAPINKADYFKQKLGKAPLGKTEKTHLVNEEMLYKSKCEDCNTAEFVKGSDGNPKFNPCACFRVLKNDEEGRPYRFVQPIKKSDGTFGLQFAKDADPEQVKLFLLTLKAMVLIKKNHGI